MHEKDKKKNIDETLFGKDYYKLRQLTLLQIATRGYYKLRQVLQIATVYVCLRSTSNNAQTV